MRDSKPDSASQPSFDSGKYMSTANGNCRNDKIVWTNANCSTTTIISSSDSPNGVCVPLKAITSYSSTIGDRYSAVLTKFYLFANYF